MTPRNVLFITTDQQHWSTVGFQNPEVRTPNLDRLAAEGGVYDRAYCPNPTCTPTRASIITGLYPSQHGAWSLGTKLDEQVPTLGDLLHDEGYRTALIGKAHFQPTAETERYTSLESVSRLHDREFWRSFPGPFYGFDDFELCRNHVDEHLVGQHYLLWLEDQGCDWRSWYRKPIGASDGQFLTWNIPAEYHYTTWIADRTMAYLDRYHRDQVPHVTWASFPDPHPPYLVPEPWASMYDPASISLPPHPTPEEIRRSSSLHRLTQERDPDFSAWRKSGYALHGCHGHRWSDAWYHPGWDNEELQRKALAVYYGMMSMTDHHIGRILEHLDKSGHAQNTMVIFTSDHGHYFGQHGLVAKGPFHYEDGIRVPFVCKIPGVQPHRSDALVSLVDIAPTIAEYVGLQVPERMAGKSQLSVFRRERSAVRDHVICENRHERDTVFLETMVTDRFKLTVYRNEDHGDLFDLETDPGETNNLWNDPDSQELKRELLLRFVKAEMDKAPRFMPRIAGA